MEITVVLIKLRIISMIWIRGKQTTTNQNNQKKKESRKVSIV